MENSRCKMLALTALETWSPVFRQQPPRKNVRLLFAFCSLNFYNFFVNEGGAGQGNMENGAWEKAQSHRLSADSRYDTRGDIAAVEIQAAPPLFPKTTNGVP